MTFKSSLIKLYKLSIFHFQKKVKVTKVLICLKKIEIVIKNQDKCIFPKTTWILYLKYVLNDYHTKSDSKTYIVNFNLFIV